jgi:electron transfer flavoprotein beta subunit
MAEEALREGLASGAERAVLLTDPAFAGSDSLATARTLAAALRRIGVPDLIIAGEKTTDGETGQVGPEVAALLGMPAVTRVTSLVKTEDGIEINSTLEEGILTQSLPLPCLVTVLSDINVPPLPTFSGKKRAYSAKIDTMTAADIKLEPMDTGFCSSPTRVVKIDRPRVTRTAERFSAKHPDELEAGLNRIVDILSVCSIIEEPEKCQKN